MDYMCPKCKSKLYEVENKLICIEDKCSFKCKTEEISKNIIEQYNYTIFDDTIFSKNVFSDFTYILAKMYRQFYDFTKGNNLYGIMFQLKDIFELLLKLPTLLLLENYFVDKKREAKHLEIIGILFSKKLSLGNWKSLAEKCLEIDIDSYLLLLIDKTLKFYKKLEIVTWRNNNIGHGILQHEESIDFQKDLYNKIIELKKYFDENEALYIKIDLRCKSKKNNSKMLGENCSIKNNYDNIVFCDNNIEKNLNLFFRIINNSIFIFDGSHNNKFKYLDYINGTVNNIKNFDLENIRKNIQKENNVNKISEDCIQNNVYIDINEKNFENINLEKKIETPTYLIEWVNQSLNNNKKGLFLLRMESGMGKTVFTKSLDVEYSNNNKIDNCIIKTYYINNYYSYKEGVFKNNIIDKLKTDTVNGRNLKGELPTFINDGDKNKKEIFASILNEFKKIYMEKYGVSNMLLILDGIDEIQFDSADSILDYIPEKEMIDDGIYILLTCRNKDQTAANINKSLEAAKFNNIFEVGTNNIQHINLLKKYIKNQLNISNDLFINAILHYINYKFISLNIFYQLLQSKTFEFKNETIDEEQIIIKFLELQEFNYSEKYYKNIKIILLAIAITRTFLSVEELIYLIDYDDINFKLLTYISDVSCLLMKDRTYRGNALGFSHTSVRNIIIKFYRNDINQFCINLINKISIKDILKDKNHDGIDFILYNSLYMVSKFSLSANYNFFNTKYYKEIEKRFNESNKKIHQIRYYITFIDDAIEKLSIDFSSCSEENFNTYVELSLNKINICMEYFFDYSNNILDELDELHCKIESRYQTSKYITQILVKKVNYFRMIGNIKKSMENIEKFMEMAKENNSIREVNNDILNIQLKLTEGINCKNLGRINDAINILDEVEDKINKFEYPYSLMLKSDADNLRGLCHKHIYDISSDEDDLKLADKLISNAYKLCNQIYEEYNYGGPNRFYILTNMAQIFRRKNKREDALDIYESLEKELLSKQYNGNSFDNILLGMVYNGIGNIYFDLGKEDNTIQSNESIENALQYYLKAETVNDLIEKNNKSLTFTGLLLKNIYNLYNYIKDDSRVSEYLNKLENLQIQLYKKQHGKIDDEISREMIEKDEMTYSIQLVLQQIDILKEKNKYDEIITIANKLMTIIEEKNSSMFLIPLKILDYEIISAKYSILYNEVNKRFYNKQRRYVALQNGSIDFHDKFARDDYSAFEPTHILNKLIDYCNDKIMHEIFQNEFFADNYIKISYIYCEVIKNYDFAEEYANKAINAGYSLEGAYNTKANALYEKGNYKEALSYYRKVININPLNEGARNNIRWTELVLNTQFK